MKLAAWLLLAVSSASFAANVIVDQAEERQRQVCAEMAKPYAGFLLVHELEDDSATAALGYEYE